MVFGPAADFDPASARLDGVAISYVQVRPAALLRGQFRIDGVYSAAIVTVRNAYARRTANGLCFPDTRYRRLSGHDDWHLARWMLKHAGVTATSNGRLLSSQGTRGH